MRALLVQDASLFIRESMDKLVRAMTREHRHNAIAFQIFKDRAFVIMDR